MVLFFKFPFLRIPVELNLWSFRTSYIVTQIILTGVKIKFDLSTNFRDLRSVVLLFILNKFLQDRLALLLQWEHFPILVALVLVNPCHLIEWPLVMVLHPLLPVPLHLQSEDSMKLRSNKDKIKDKFNYDEKQEEGKH